MLLQVDVELLAIVKANHMRAVGVQLADVAREPRHARIAAELNLDALANMFHGSAQSTPRARLGSPVQSSQVKSSQVSFSYVLCVRLTLSVDSHLHC